MTQHDHTTYVDGCYRCELGRDEAEAAAAEAACDTCEGEGQVCVGFGIYSDMRPGIARCSHCNGTGVAPSSQEDDR